MPIAYIGLGSNLGDRVGQVLEAARTMAHFARIRKISRLHETEPVGLRDQPDFINGVVEIETDLSPTELMQELLEIEAFMGRVRGEKDGPREIDLDLLIYGDEVIEEVDLIVPHPELHHRRFALEPLAQLNPNYVHPVLKKTIAELLRLLPDETKH